MTGNRSIDFRLYLITDRKLFESSQKMLISVEKALEGGVRAVQLREKDLGVRELIDLALRMRELTREFDARLFINDRSDVALAVDADGVHLGADCLSVQAVRKACGSRLMTGVSTHSVEDAVKAQKDGADFITLGPVYETPSKMLYGNPVGLQVIKEASEAQSLPVFAIGGMTAGRIEEVLGQGASGIALISAILGANDIKKTTEEFMRKLS